MCAWLVTYALHSCVFIGGAWAASIALSRLPVRDGTLALVRERLWKLALVGGIATATVQTVFGGGPFALVVEPRAAHAVAELSATPRARASAVAPPVRIASEPAVAAEPGVAIDPASFSSALPAVNRGEIEISSTLPLAIPAVQRSIGEEAEEMGAPQPLALALPPTWISVLLATWLAGVSFGLVRWLVDWRKLVGALRGRRDIASGPAREVFVELVRRAGIGSGVRLLHAPRIAAPITIGLLRPAICIPPRAATDLQRDELEALLAHELAHALRRDPAWLCACRAIEVVLFFQPLNRLARVRLADEAEVLCDDWAVRHTRERLSLASCLTEIAGWIVGRERELAAPGMAGRGSRLEVRVHRLLEGAAHSTEIALGDSSETDVEEARIPRWMTPIACGAFGAVALFAPGVSARSTTAQENGLVARDLELPDAEPDAQNDEHERDDDASDRSTDLAQREDADDAQENDIESATRPLSDIEAGKAALLALEMPGFLSSAPAPARTEFAREMPVHEAIVRDSDGAPTSSQGPSSPATPCAPDPAPTCSSGTDSMLAPAAPAVASNARGASTAPNVVALAPKPSSPLARKNAPPTRPQSPKTANAFAKQPPSMAFGIQPGRIHMLGADPLARELAQEQLSLANGAARSGSMVANPDALADARTLETELAALEDAMCALKSELTSRRAPAEMQRRMRELEQELRSLREQRTELVRLMNLAAAPPAGRDANEVHDSIDTQDRK
jgi:beta-lactamase regulating signal transducer with metallopeptidase domain